MSTKISVIICAYNYACFLPECLQSVISQIRPADEIIVVDDGSTDETPDVVKRFPQIRYIRQDNAGKAVAFNRGFSESQGKIICHLDADDYWLPDKLARVSDVFNRTDVGGVLHDAFYVDAYGEYLYGSETLSQLALPERRFSFRDTLLLCFIYPPWNTLPGRFGVSNTISVRREAVEDRFPLPADLGLAIDGALIFSAARHGLLCLPQKLSAYRHHGNNGFVSSPASIGFQGRLYQWIQAIPGVTAKDRSLTQALALELDAHMAAHLRQNPVGGACGAVLLLPKLIGLGLVPHWKHLALPVGSLFGWRRIHGTRATVARVR